MNDNFRHVLIAEDDPDDRALIGDALIDAGFHAPDYVKDGQELLDYLERADSNGDQTRFPIRPSLILIDLNMPRVDGLAAIRQIRSDPRFPVLALVVLKYHPHGDTGLRYGRPSCAGLFVALSVG